MDQKEKYRKFCRQHNDLPIFFKDWFLDAVCEDGEWNVVIIEKGNEIQGVLPYFKKRKWGFQYIAMPHFVKHLGPYLPQSKEKSLPIVQALIEGLPKIDCFKQDFTPQVTDWLPFYWKGFQQSTRYTYVIDLSQPLDLIYQGINRNMRRNIKKAEKELSIVHNLDLNTFYQINQKSFTRQQLATPYSFKLLQQQDDALLKQQARQLFFAKDTSGNLHSAAYLIWDKNRAYYHLSGDDPDFRKSGSGIYLIWKAIEYAKNQLGVSFFDFEGSMMPNVEAIRRQFGARQVPFFSIWKYNSKLYKLIDQVKG